MGDGDAHLRAVGQVNRLLYQTFTKGAAAHDDAAVPILHSTGGNLTGGGRVLIDEHNQAALTEHAAGK